MNYRLFVDLEAIATLNSLPAGVRRRLLDHLTKLRSSPESFSSGRTRDEVGRQVEVSFVAGYVIHYWIDFADRHIKVLRINSQR